ncbi:DUF1613-domain-containing protein [Microstroma glucosiphilum]|uniref:tRNA (uracil-O(2)-)-methyltransferase n=1 Tax=Pseudomicrostroma glucosiphilum TaxID=1684307 RepID=A0A316U0T0_9BASI|nr:DUF1613-domain-containing protein [Pseudomicrostroma glucosiphilum]PWN18468.1 DUF1613-domain-containing protein [Pseudomicrostroma glucosiphilum]
MASWYSDIPIHTAPPVLNAIPPRPPFEHTLGAAQHEQTKSTGAAKSLKLPSDGLWATNQQGEGQQWEHVIQCKAVADVESWSTVMLELVRHPERNSSNILRADILLDEVKESEEGHASLGAQEGQLQWTLHRQFVRRLLPRRPGIDSHLDQLCSFFQSSDAAGFSRLVVYTPLQCSVARPFDLSTVAGTKEWLSRHSAMTDPEQVPFYHPAVKALAFAYLSDSSHTGGIPDDSSAAANILSISALPFGSAQLSPTIRRICTTLLKTIHTHTWGVSHSYVTRVPQDRLVPKEMYQDVYLNLKHRWAGYLVKEWREGTDPEKHVHEDLALAAWLMCLWRIKFGGAAGEEEVTVGLKERPWLTDSQSWSRPPGGFVDVGCGNGLLVWLLNNEGYEGHGFDLRPRKSWELFQTGASTIEGQVSTRCADLRVQTLDAIRFIQDLLEAPQDASGNDLSLFPPHCFLIGNHADELTPILPLLSAALPSCAGMLNIPCCAWSVEGVRFNKAKYSVTREEVAELLDLPQRSLLKSQMLELGLGPPVDAPVPRKAKASASPSGPSAACASSAKTPGGSRNVAYLSYVSHLHLLCGWLVEKEALRIPSTKNWGIVSTRKVGSEVAARDRVRTLIEGVGGGWKARSREGEGKWFLSAAEKGDHRG